MAKVEKCTCRRCSMEVSLKDYYKSYSELNGVNGKLQICKDCVSKLYTKLLNKYNGDVKSTMIHLCLMLDVYFSEKLFVECSASETFSLSDYFRRVNMEKATKNLCSLDNSINTEVDSNKKIQIGDELIDENIIDFWGEGYKSKEYIKLEKKYRKYTNHYPSETLQEQEIIKNLCELEIMRENCRINNKPSEFDKLNTQIRKTMEDLNVLPSKMQKYGSSDKITPGQLILEVEQNEPIPSTHPEFADVDKIQWMINRYIVRPLKLFFGIETGDITYSDVEGETYEDYKKQTKK